MTTDPALRARDKAWWTIRTALYAAGFSKGQRDEIEAAALAAAEAAPQREPGHGPPYDLAFIRECVARNPGGYTGEFRFLLSLVDAAEAAPLDVERLDELLRHLFARIGSLRVTGDWPMRRLQVLSIITEERAILAALRSPDTETAGEAGLDRAAREAQVRSEHEATHGEAEQCGAECIALGLTEFDTETAGEAG